MDTAFYNRTGFTSGWSYGEVNFYPHEGGWLKRVHPYYWTKHGHDQTQNGKEDFLNTGIRFHFTRQGYLQLASGRGHEAWVGHRFKDGAVINVYSSMQMFRWLSAYGSFNKNRDIYYDLVNPYQGRSRSGSAGFSLQPNQHFQQNVDFNTVHFDRSSDGAHIYTVNIINTQTTYQFDKHFRLRLLEEFDSSQHQLLTDLLAMYEVVPGTVFHAGYGSLYEKDPTQGITPQYMTIRRGLFFKASYLRRF
jgi:hypothetical protein